MDDVRPQPGFSPSPAGQRDIFNVSGGEQTRKEDEEEEGQDEGQAEDHRGRHSGKILR